MDRFDPLTYFGAGVVTVTVRGTLIGCKTFRESFTEPVKFFRVASSSSNLNGWSAVDAFQDGAWGESWERRAGQARDGARLMG